MEPYICPWDTTYFFIAEGVPPLLYYSHIPAIIIALLIGFFIFIQNKRSAASITLLLTLLLFSVWATIDMFLWSNNRTDLSLFWWSVQILTELLIYASALVLTYRFVLQKMPSFMQLLGLSAITLPAILLMPTNLYLLGIDDYCVAEENPFIIYFSYGYEILVIVGIIGITLYTVIKKYDRNFIYQGFLFAAGIILFLAAFTSGNIIGSLTEDWDLAQYGLFGLPVFTAFLAYLIVRFNSFNAKMIAAQALVAALVITVGSMALFTESHTNTILVVINFILVTIGGFLLVRSVQREIAQRLEIEKLAKRLEKANARLKVLDQMKSEFVSIASHQLRSPLTSIRGYASMLLEGSYGKLSEKAKDAVERISDSSRMMASSVEDYLNVSRIQAGNMKYNYSDFNVVDMASKVVDDVRREAVRKGLVISFKSDMNKQGIVHADNGKTMQIIHNLINNSIKYTPKGTITVFAHDKGKSVFIDIVDTGIGMSKETIENIFGKFERAKNANEVNVTGTGLGLYVAQKMAEEMGGSIEAFSDGEGKGSTFRLTLPLQM